MRLRSGNKYNNIKPIPDCISVEYIIILQSIARRYISTLKYKECILAIKLLKKVAPHLYKYKPRIKKPPKKKNSNLDEETNVNDLHEIIAQYDEIKNLGRTSKNGIIRSKRANKGKNPDRYVDPNFKKIFMEDNTIDDFLGSDSDDIDSDDSIGEDIVYSGEEDGEWDSNNETSFNESDEEY